MLVELTAAAQADALQAALAYEAERPGLGFRFDAELDRALGRIGDNPLQFPLVHADVRRGLLKIFPYAVYFVMVGDHARVFAVLHQHRRPESWKPRTPG